MYVTFIIHKFLRYDDQKIKVNVFHVPLNWKVSIRIDETYYPLNLNVLCIRFLVSTLTLRLLYY